MKCIVSIVEDNASFQEALVKIIEESDDFLLGLVYTSAEAALEMVQTKPDVAIIDIQLPGMSGIELIKHLKTKASTIQCLVCSMYDDDEKIVKSLENGASGYIIKESTAGQIHAALIEMVKGGAPMSPYVAKRVISFFHKTNQTATDALLTGREKEVLSLVAKGMQYKEIANKLFISYETVKKHLKNIYEKLHVQNKVEALNKLRLL